MSFVTQEKSDSYISLERTFSSGPFFHPKRILIYVGKDLLGDALIKLPFLRGIRSLYPESEIIWCAGQGKSVLSTFLAPLTKGLLTGVWDDLSYGGSWLDALSPPKRLTSPPFDLIIDTQKHLKTTLLLKRLPHEHFISSAMNFYFSDRSPPPRVKGRVSLQEDLNRLLLTCSPAVDYQTIRPLEVPQESIALAKRLLPEGRPYIGLVPGGGGRHKCWPLNRFVELAEWLHDEGFIPVFILGPQEEEWVEGIRAQLPWALFPLQHSDTIEQGGPTLFLTMALGRRLRLAVSNDCGTAHLLAVVDTPLLSLFGPTNAVKFKPASRIVHTLQAITWGGKDMSCIPLEAVKEGVRVLQNRL